MIYLGFIQQQKPDNVLQHTKCIYQSDEMQKNTLKSHLKQPDFYPKAASFTPNCKQMQQIWTQTTESFYRCCAVSRAAGKRDRQKENAFPQCTPLMREWRM